MALLAGPVVARLESEAYDAGPPAPSVPADASSSTRPALVRPAVVRPIVVGVDGSAASSAAVVWAAVEAARDARPLHLVHAFEVAGATTSPMVVAPLAWYDPQWSLKAAAEVVGTVAPEVPTTSTQSNQPPAETLVSASYEAGLVVVGTRGHTAVGALVLGSTAARVAAHAHCPVVVVRESPRVDAARRVVVGIDGSPASSTALAFAAGWAADHGCLLVVTHLWTGDLTVDAVRVTQEVREEIRATLVRGQMEVAEALLQPVRRAHPGLPVDVLVDTGAPEEALVAQSGDAQLVVVGSRGRGLLKGLVIGSVSEHVLHHAHCPVVVVPSPVAV